MHELGHTIGLYHEHERDDRDLYVEIDYQFIPDNEYVRGEFEKKKKRYWYALPYDYGSIMHFPLDAYSKDGNNTIIPLAPYSGDIGQRKRLSHWDRSAINNLYECSDVGMFPFVCLFLSIN